MDSKTGLETRSGAASSHEPPPAQLSSEDGMDQAYEERAREEDRQQREDEELYEWHTQQAAREAQLDDRAAVLAHMGWNIKTTKRWQLVVEIQAGQEQHQMTVPLAENEAVRTQLTTRLNTETEYSFQGRPQEPELARKRIAEATEAHVIEERLRGEKGSKRRTYLSLSIGNSWKHAGSGPSVCPPRRAFAAQVLLQAQASEEFLFFCRQRSSQSLCEGQDTHKTAPTPDNPRHTVHTVLLQRHFQFRFWLRGFLP